MKTTNTSMPHKEILWSRSITELSQLDGRVYVRLLTPELAAQFLQRAETEGFTFADGVKPTKLEAAEIMAINHDHTINYVGINGRIAFNCADTVGNKHMIRVSFKSDVADTVL